MGVSLSWCQGATAVLRAGAQHQKYGDPYSIAGTVEINPHDPESATVMGFIATESMLADWLEFRQLLRRFGIRRLSIERIRDGRHTQREWRI